jgi:hypothetical protein
MQGHLRLFGCQHADKARHTCCKLGFLCYADEEVVLPRAQYASQAHVHVPRRQATTAGKQLAITTVIPGKLDCWMYTSSPS